MSVKIYPLFYFNVLNIWLNHKAMRGVTIYILFCHSTVQVSLVSSNSAKV